MTYKLNYKLPNGKIVFSIEWERGYSSARLYKDTSGPILKEFNSRHELSNGETILIDGREYYIQLTPEAKGIEVSRDGMQLLGSKMNPKKMLGGISTFGWMGFVVFGVLSFLVTVGFPKSAIGEIMFLISMILFAVNSPILLIGAILMTCKVYNGYFLILTGICISIFAGLLYATAVNDPLGWLFCLIGLIFKVVFLIQLLKLLKNIKKAKVHTKAVQHFWSQAESL